MYKNGVVLDTSLSFLAYHPEYAECSSKYDDCDNDEALEIMQKWLKQKQEDREKEQELKLLEEKRELRHKKWKAVWEEQELRQLCQLRQLRQLRQPLQLGQLRQLRQEPELCQLRQLGKEKELHQLRQLRQEQEELCQVSQLYQEQELRHKKWEELLEEQEQEEQKWEELLEEQEQELLEEKQEEHRQGILDLDHHRLRANLRCAPRSAVVSGVSNLVPSIIGGEQTDENRFLKLENMGVKNARNMVAKIRRDNAEIKVLNKRIEEKKRLMVVSISGYQSFVITVAKMSEEVNNPTKKLFSQPFFLEKYRYKLSLQVNMDGSGGSLSVFVHIMKGDFDSILKWPFMHRIAIKVKNQKEGDDSVHIVQPESTGIQKPEINQNITFGSRNFPTYSELLTGGFVRDDSISIECEVLWN